MPLYPLALCLSSESAKLNKTILRMAMTFSQNDWYQQRYGSAQAQRRPRQKIMQDTASFEAIKEYHQARRETFQSHAAVIFSEHGISYEVRGHIWLCSVGHEAIYYWSHVQRWCVKGQFKIWGSRGVKDFLDKVFAWQRNQKA